VTYPRRTYPHGHQQYVALDADWWTAVLDGSQKVAVYWPTGANAVTLVGYYDTVSAANTAAAAAVSAAGAYPRVRVNWSHPDITHVSCGPVQHPDARESLPAWIDAAPAY
jgi:hypothetical protein